MHQTQFSATNKCLSSIVAVNPTGNWALLGVEGEGLFNSIKNVSGYDWKLSKGNVALKKGESGVSVTADLSVVLQYNALSASTMASVKFALVVSKKVPTTVPEKAHIQELSFSVLSGMPGNTDLVALSITDEFRLKSYKKHKIYVMFSAPVDIGGTYKVGIARINLSGCGLTEIECKDEDAEDKCGAAS